MRFETLVPLSVLTVMSSIAGLLMPAIAAGSPPRCRGEKATIVGTSGSDNLVGTRGRDVVVALGGDDIIRVKGGDDLVCAGAGGDIVYGGRGRDVLRGQAGDDRLIGGPGSDILVGRKGNDVERGGRGPDFFDLGTDTGDDYIDGGEGGEAGCFGLGRAKCAYWLRGDYIEFGASRSPVSVDLVAGTATGVGQDVIEPGTIESIWGSYWSDTLVGDEQDNVIFGGIGIDSQPDLIDGGPGDDYLEGSELGDTIFGGEGDDILDGGIGDDQLDGGPGNDFGQFCGRFNGFQGNPVTVDLLAGTAVRQFEEDSFVGLENAEGCDDNDTLLGDEGPNILLGAGGDDMIDGRGGDDILRGDATSAPNAFFLIGGYGDDEIHGGLGDDELYGGRKVDFLDGGPGTDYCKGGESEIGCE